MKLKLFEMTWTYQGVVTQEVNYWKALLAQMIAWLKIIIFSFVVIQGLQSAGIDIKEADIGVGQFEEATRSIF